MIDFNAYKRKLLSLGVELNDPVPPDYWKKNETKCPFFLRDLYTVFNGTKDSDMDMRNALNIASLEQSEDILENLKEKGWVTDESTQYFILGDVLLNAFYIGIPQTVEESVVIISGTREPEAVSESFEGFFEIIYEGNL